MIPRDVTSKVIRSGIAFDNQNLRFPVQLKGSASVLLLYGHPIKNSLPNSYLLAESEKQRNNVSLDEIFEADALVS